MLWSMWNLLITYMSDYWPDRTCELCKQESDQFHNTTPDKIEYIQ